MNKKEIYHQNLQAQLNEWSEQTDKLRAKADKAGADAQLEYNKHIEELRSSQQAAIIKLAELKDANDDAWEDLKAGMDSAWSSIGKTLKSATSRYR